MSLKNAKHEAVVQAYIADPERIGWKAYQAVYPDASQHAAETCFGRLLKKVEFAARVAELDTAVTAKAVEVAGVTKARVIEELAKLGFSNMRDYIRIGPDGLPYTDFSALTRDQAAAISEITVETRRDPTAAAETDEELEPQGHGGALKRERASDGPGPEIVKVRFKLADKKGPLTELGKHLGLFKDDKTGGVDPNAVPEPRHPGHDHLAALAERFGRALKVVQGGKGTG